MAIARAFRKRRALTGSQGRLAGVFDEYELALEHENEFVLVTVPVALARPAAGRQGHQVDAEVAQATGVTEAPPRSCRARRIERRWISRTLSCGDRGNVYLWHVRDFSRSLATLQGS